MSRWADTFRALAQGADTVDTVDTIGAHPALPANVSQSVHSVPLVGLTNGTAGPIGPCLTCGSYGWWRRNLLDGPDAPGPWRCAACSPIPKGAGWLDVAIPALRPDAVRALLREAERARVGV